MFTHAIVRWRNTNDCSAFCIFKVLCSLFIGIAIFWKKAARVDPNGHLLKIIIFVGIAILNVEKTNPMVNSSFPAVPGQNLDCKNVDSKIYYYRIIKVKPILKKTGLQLGKINKYFS